MVAALVLVAWLMAMVYASDVPIGDSENAIFNRIGKSSSVLGGF